VEIFLNTRKHKWFKSWPPERFAELADRLTFEYSCQVLIGGSRQDMDLAQQIRQMAKSSPVIMAGRTTIKQLGAFAKKTAFFVGSDGGAMPLPSQWAHWESIGEDYWNVHSPSEGALREGYSMPLVSVIMPVYNASDFSGNRWKAYLPRPIRTMKLFVWMMAPRILPWQSLTNTGTE
jgi:Glycosyltransferase family 9 (heptosyltransferase)